MFVAFRAAEFQRVGVPAVAVEGGEVAGEEARLALAVATGDDHQHVVAECFSESVQCLRHVR